MRYVQRHTQPNGQHQCGLWSTIWCFAISYVFSHSNELNEYHCLNLIQVKCKAHHFFYSGGSSGDLCNWICHVAQASGSDWIWIQQALWPGDILMMCFEWMTEWMNRIALHWIDWNEWMNEMNEWMNEWTNERTNERTNEGRKEGIELKWNEMKWNEMDEWLNEWMNEWMNERRNE